MESEQLPEAAFRSIFLRMLDNPDDVLLIDEMTDAVTGVLHLRIEAQLHHAAKTAEIMELSVGGAYRSGGIGKALLEAARQTARTHGCTRIEVSSNRVRERAHHFYEREG